ncbi:MAG: Uma2 family endonuclease, partial [Singulisphaera sp.]
HQELVVLLSSVFQDTVGWTGLGKVLPGANITDMEEGWTHNYRCPDVVVFLNGGRAINRETHFFGGPDFAVEIVSENDRSREKLPFYARVGVRELLLVDRDPWVLELFRLQEDRLMPVGRSTLENPDVLASTVLPLSFGLIPGETRPRIAVAHEDGIARWVL